jgi:hypothetical protein
MDYSVSMFGQPLGDARFGRRYDRAPVRESFDDWQADLLAPGGGSLGWKSEHLAGAQSAMDLLAGRIDHYLDGGIVSSGLESEAAKPSLADDRESRLGMAFPNQWPRSHELGKPLPLV